MSCLHLNRDYHAIGNQVNKRSIDFKVRFRYFGEGYPNNNFKGAHKQPCLWFEGVIMKKVKEVEIKYVSLNTALIIGLVGLIVGFIAGNIYSLYKSGSFSSKPADIPSANMSISTEQSARMLALEREVEKNPDSLAAWLELGNLYFDTRKYQDAIRAYTQYLGLNPNNPDVWTDLGVMYRRSGNPAEAISSFDKAIELDPRHEQAFFNKGIVQLHDLGNREAAMQTWQELIKINPNFQTPTGQTIKELVEKL
jgi:tetratricopeptide (TPR) repeat protein